MNSVYDCDIIKQLSDDFVHTINFVFIDFKGKSVFCVTNDDNVYGFGDNTYGYLGLGHKNAINEPTKIEELCHKQVITIETGGSSLVALTKTGHIYSWGYNSCGQIGNGTKVECITPDIISSLIERFITDVKCGKYHCLALTMNGEVFEWGWSVNDVNNTTPIKVKNGLELHTIIDISCGEYHSLALTDNGDVYSWGENDFGQCGTASYDNQITPIKVNALSGIKIVKISCRQKCNVLLSENGDIYVFGQKDCDQNSDGVSDNEANPIKLSTLTNFVDIASHWYHNYISVCLSCDGFCYVWGKVDDEVIDKPKKTQFTDIDEAFANFTKYLYRTYYFKKSFENLSANERFKQSFNKSESSDIEFKIDGKFIFTQKQYLKTVCKHFQAMFSENVWLESNANEIEITQYSYSVYFSFLKYLYTDSVDIQSKHLIELYYLADSYMERHLKHKCIETMKNATNISNVYLYYSFAVKNNLSKLEKYLFDYMRPVMCDVIKTEAYLQTNDITDLQKFVSNVAVNGYLLK